LGRVWEKWGEEVDDRNAPERATRTFLLQNKKGPDASRMTGGTIGGLGTKVEEKGGRKELEEYWVDHQRAKSARGW